MAGLGDAVRRRLRSARARVKGFAYSGIARDRWQHPDRVIAVLGVRAGDHVADVGAGAGYFAFRLADAVGPAGRVYAVDTDADMSAFVAEQAARTGRANVVVVDAQPQDPALPQAVDLVLLVDAYHHVPASADYFARLGRSLRPGGRVAVIEALPRGLHRLVGHATHPATIRSTLVDAGFRLAGEHGFLTRQSFQVFERARA